MLPPPLNQWLSVPYESSGHAIWVWNFPQAAPQTIAVKLPWDQLQPAGIQVSVHAVIRSIRLSTPQLSSVVVNGQTYGLQSDFLLTPQFTGQDGLLSFTVALGQPAPSMPPQHQSAQPHMGPVAPVMGGHGGMVDEAVYKRADADWKSTLYLETQATTLRKQLGGAQSRLGALNKDLTPEENRHASRQDIGDWTDARRFLRDAAAKVGRYIKEYDIGVTSSAGRRNWMETNYEQYIRTRQPFGQMEQMQREFEVYRKLLQSLVNNMTSAIAFAQQDGETRAKQVLARIRSSTRKNKGKMRKK